MITPPELADQLEDDGRTTLEILDTLKHYTPDFKGELISEIEDLYTWSYLSLYFSEKIRGGLALQKFRSMGDTSDQKKSIFHLKNALSHWIKVVDHTKDRYNPVPHVSIPEEEWGKRMFSWEFYLSHVENDITIAEEAEFKN
jgi:hypothetical protein